MGKQAKFNQDMLLAKASKVFEIALEDEAIRDDLQKLYMGKDPGELAVYLEKTFGIDEKESGQIQVLFQKLEKPSIEKASLWV